MERENRYVVLKISDIDDHLNTDQKMQLGDICQCLDNSRFHQNKDPLKCVVVENDWPMYESVWKSIEAWAGNGELNGFNPNRDLLESLQTTLDEHVKVISSYAIKTFNLENEVAERKAAEDQIYNIIYGNAGPLNDNKLGFTHKQMVPFLDIASLLSV